MNFVYKWNKYNPKTDTEWFIGMIGSKMIVCVNGTDALPKGIFDWIINLFIFRLPVIINGRVVFVHCGLWKKAMSILPEIKAYIKTHKPEEIEFKGYSQGSCVQYIAAKLIQKHSFLKCITAGSFRAWGLVGLLYIKKLLKNNFINLQFGNDIVTKIPFLMFHAGRIQRKGIRKFGKLSVQDHDLDNYSNMKGAS